MSIEKNIFCNTEQPTTVQIVTTGVFFHRINFMWCFRSNLHNSNLANGVTNISMTILSVISGNNSQGQRTTVNIPGYLHSARHVAYITATALNRLFLLSEYNTESLQWWTKLCLKKMSQVWLAIALMHIHLSVQLLAHWWMCVKVSIAGQNWDIFWDILYIHIFQDIPSFGRHSNYQAMLQ